MGCQIENLPEAIRGSMKMLLLSLILFCTTPLGIPVTIRRQKWRVWIWRP